MQANADGTVSTSQALAVTGATSITGDLSVTGNMLVSTRSDVSCFRLVSLGVNDKSQSLHA